MEDALVAVEAGADAVGFVFYEKSPRCVSVETAREIVAKLPKSVEKVGVFVGGAGADWVQPVLSAGLTAAQQYLPLESDVRSLLAKAGWRDSCQKPLKLFLALPIGRFLETGADFSGIAEDFKHLHDDVPGCPPIPEGVLDTFFLDSGGAKCPGGTGRTFDWRKAVPFAEEMKQAGLNLVVAGGLTPENVGKAMETLKPWGVDVASGVEARPGKKDPEKVRAFVRAVREMDRKAGSHAE